MNLKDEILKLTNAAPSIRDEQDISDDETAAKLDKYTNNEDNVDEYGDYSTKLIRPHVDLAEYSKKYEGKKAKRSDLYENFGDEDGGDDGGGDDESDIEEDEDEVDGSDDEEDEEEDEDELEEPAKKPLKKSLKDDSTDNIKVVNVSNEEQKKGKAVKSQLTFWDVLLDHRMKLQNMLKPINEYPHYDELPHFIANLNETGKFKHEENATIALNLFNELADFNKNFSKLSQSENSEGNNKRKSQDDGLNGDNSKKIKFNEIESYLSQSYTKYIGERNETLQKWYEKTSLIGSKSMKALEKPVIQQLENLLMDKDRIIRRTQLKRVVYNRIVKDEKQDEQKHENDVNLKDYDAEIFDDQDIYQQLLREIISRRSESLTNPLELSKNSVALQKLKSSKKKVVDTKASKGRKLRFDVHKQLVSFMAPIYKNLMAESAK